MAEHVVEDVRLLQIVDLFRLPNKPPGDEGAVRQVAEEDIVWHEARHGDDPPSGKGLQPLGELVEVGDAALGQPQDIEPVQERRGGAAFEQLGLAGEQSVPYRVLPG
jgi:hypothetical protein